MSKKKNYSATVFVILILIAVVAVGIIILNEILGWPLASKTDRDSNYGNSDSGILEPETREPYYSKKKRY